MFCAIYTSFRTMILFCRKESISRIETSIVRATLCTSVPQGANHFCGPSDLLSTTTTCFSQLISDIVWCSSCGQNLIQFATPRRPLAKTVCLTCTFAEPKNSLPKSGHEHYHNSSNIAYIISHVHTEFLDCFMGGLPALDTFPRFTCPQIIPHKLAVLRLAHLCTPCTDHPCSNCPVYQDAHFSVFFLNMQAELVFSCSEKNGNCFKFCSWTFVKIAHLHISCIPMPQ
jgi:hypothetical protein